MNSTPTGGSATPSSDGDDRGVTGAEDRPSEKEAGGLTVPSVPVPRSGVHPLPRRARSTGGPRDTGRDTDPGSDPDGRRYTDPDAATLDRLLSGLRDI